MLAALATRLGVVREVGTVLDVTSAVLLPFTAAQSLVAWGGHTLRVRPTFGGQSRGSGLGAGPGRGASRSARSGQSAVCGPVLTGQLRGIVPKPAEGTLPFNENQ